MVSQDQYQNKTDCLKYRFDRQTDPAPKAKDWEKIIGMYKFQSISGYAKQHFQQKLKDKGADHMLS